MTATHSFPSITKTRQVRILKTHYQELKRLGKGTRRSVPGQLEILLTRLFEEDEHESVESLN